MTVKEHYDNFLGNFYAWMIGEFQEKQREQQAFFETAGLSPMETSVALDLGCGHGLQAVSLARLGFSVKAIDFNRQLLQDLTARKGELPIVCVENDLMEFLKEYREPCDVIACMGDTLTHLPDIQSVDFLFSKASRVLVKSGKIILSFRELSRELTGEQRFIPVRSDESRIHTCFLEYFPDYVKVYDILHERSATGWKQSVSWYQKLRLSVEQLESMLNEKQLTITRKENLKGMTYLVAMK